MYIEKQEAEMAVDRTIKAMAEWINKKLETEEVMPGEIQSMAALLAKLMSAGTCQNCAGNKLNGNFEVSVRKGF